MRTAKFFLIIILFIAAFLRFYRLDEIPHGLYIDEVSIGYNAFSILDSGKDEYGVSYPLFFKAFGEYKMPISIYLTSLSMAAFGKNDFAVRFPSAFLGTLSILLIYLLVKQLLEIKKTKSEIPIIAAGLLAISPWHIQFSRGGFEANIALFFYLLGGFIFLKSIKNKNVNLLLTAVISFIASVYSYNAYRLIVPITLLFCFIYFYKNFISLRKKIWILFFISVVLLLPVFIFSGVNTRFIETSAFSEFGNISFFQKLIVYPMLYLKNYLSYFSLPFLFVTSDGFGRHTISGMGLLFRWEIPFLLTGLFFLLKEKKEFFVKVIIFLLLIAPVTAAFTRPSPHALRSFLLIIPLTITCAYSLSILWNQKNKIIKLLIIGIGFIALSEFGLYLHLYYTHYPSRTALDWGAEYKQVVLEAAKEQNKYQQIVINSNVGMIQSYANFYDKDLHFIVVNNSWKKSKDIPSEKILYITSSEPEKNKYLNEIPHKLIKNIYLQSSHNGIFVQFWEI